MTDDNPYADGEDDRFDDESQPDGYGADGVPLYGTASQGSPLVGEPPQDDGDATIVIDPPNQPARRYELTDRLKEKYENSISTSLEGKDVDYYDMWWEGTTLFVEFSGKVRPPEMRPGSQKQQQAQQPQQDQQKGQQHPFKQMMQQMQQAAQQQQNDGLVLPRNPRPPFTRRKGEVQVQFPVQHDGPDTKFFDEGLLPVSGITEFDLQDRANANPLGFEDTIVEPWSDDYPVQEPISHEGEQLGDSGHFEVTDFRDKTDDKDETVQQNARGDRYHL